MFFYFRILWSSLSFNKLSNGCRTTIKKIMVTFRYLLFYNYQKVG